MIDHKTTMIPLEQIRVERESRQRSSIDKTKVKELAEDIARHGLIHPILVERDTFKLIAGEHRLQAFFYLRDCRIEPEKWHQIPCHFAYDVSPEELEALELSENIKRSAMTWTDEALAVLRYHQLQENLDSEWGVNRTAEALGLAPSTASKHLAVAREIKRSNPKVLAAGGLTTAYNIIQRNHSRAIQDELSTMDDILGEAKSVPDIETPGISIDTSERTSHTELDRNFPPELEPSPIITLSFLDWIETYSGPKFNLLHCDFPYGIGHHKSDQGNTAAWGEYDDDIGTYYNLLSALCGNLDRILLPSAHVVFWLGGDHEMHEVTRNYFNKYAPSLDINPRPLIWHKSDNKGILPDPTHGPRYTYETALFMSRGNRQVVQAIANSYAAPTARNRIHASEKPEPMLRHFFRMLVDEHTSLLDPTCGSGSALRAADSLGAKHVLGLEMNPEFAEAATDAFTRARNIAQLQEEQINV